MTFARLGLNVVRSTLVVALAGSAGAPQSCSRQGGAPRTTDIALGQAVSDTLSREGSDGTDRVELSRYRIYRLRVDRPGMVRAVLSWKNAALPIRLELWNSAYANGACCHPGESAELPVDAGNRLEIRILLVDGATRVSQQFELKTSLVSRE